MMKQMKHSLFRGALIALASSATAAATAGGNADVPEDNHQPSALFLQLDADHDGYVSSSEAATVRGFGRAFADADDNGDEKLSADEFIKAEAIRERQQMAQYADDSVITAKVKAALIRDLELKAFDVGVETYRGRVLLSGFVENRHQARRAVQVAAGVRGVARVEDALKLK
jgi:hyperosmotically inducible periplasmic protein